MVASSTALMHSSASGCTRIRSITNRLSRGELGDVERRAPDSLRTSMLIGVVLARRVAVAGASSPADRADVGCRASNSSYAATICPTSRCRTTSWAVSRLKETSSTPSRMPSTTRRPDLRAAGQVDLGDVAGDHDLGAEAEPGQEHLHLLGRGVLRLVEDDERVVERCGRACRPAARPRWCPAASSLGIDSGSSMSCSASYSGRR